MEVKLIAYNPMSYNIVAAAARGCYSDKPASELLSKTMPPAHGSCFEHVSFTFSIEGVSRVLTHQLVRHRVGTAFSQQSMRYVKTDKLWTDDHRHLAPSMVLPKSVQEVLDDQHELADSRKDEVLRNLIVEYLYDLDALINALQEYGISSEDIRYFLPNGVKSNITVTMNARELQHFCGLRRCTRAQWEIRELADKMAELVQEACPALCKHLNLGAQCDQLGYCPEHNSCGRKSKCMMPDIEETAKRTKELIQRLK